MPMDTTQPPAQPVRAGTGWRLFNVAATRALERAALAATAPHALMQRAGQATARLALALHPHARSYWIAAGPGNNGGDGMEAAMHLHGCGKQVVVTWLGDAAQAPADAAVSYGRARAAGVPFAEQPPVAWDVCIDALLGIGAARAPDGVMAQWIALIAASASPVLSIDVPTGLDADTGVATASHVVSGATLCLLTLKPGLFMADGRDCARSVWLDDLQMDASTLAPSTPASATLIAATPQQQRPHASHKGSFGDVAVVGGAPGMAGAALLAATAALHHGAGRVFLCALDEGQSGASGIALAPELMHRDVLSIDASRMTVVCGCGGGDRVHAVLPRLLSSARQLVVDADALNAVANDPALQQLLRTRSQRDAATVLTPHPLEAARLLGLTTAEVQSDRLQSAHRLAHQLGCTVVLKGSGTVVAAPGLIPRINPTGNARLATPGSGDVLAGMIGAAMAAGTAPFEAACDAVYRHGLAADQWPTGQSLTAYALARRA
ncbi:MAG: NAD(P)H-hydrate dehydratase [Burkholderiaceae bacterium]